MTFLDPCNDWAFKRIFGSRESAPVLIGFLNDLLHHGRPVIEKVHILDPYLPSQIKNLKDSAVDVRATLQDGSEVLIEMQMLPVAGFCERVLYNGAKCISSQLGRGMNYTRIRPVTVITVADCVLLPETDAWLNHYTMREKRRNSPWPVSGIEIVFIELPKIKLEEMPDSEPLHDWLEFLKNATQWHTMPRKVTNTAVREALRLARQDNLSTSEAHIMTRRQLYRHDQKNMILYAVNQGRQEGRMEGRMDIARALLARGMSEAEVLELTGLPKLELSKSATPKTAPRVTRKRSAKA